METILKGKNILLVDDDLRHTFALTNYFEELNVHVDSAPNGLEGLEFLIMNTDIDLVLMDIMMPSMDGYEAIQLIRKLEHYNKLPIIALTGKKMEEDIKKCYQVGASEHVAKPINIRELLEKMTKLLTKQND